MLRTVSHKPCVITPSSHILEPHVLIKNEARILYLTYETVSRKPCVITPVYVIQPHVVIRNERRISYLLSGTVRRKTVRNQPVYVNNLVHVLK